MDSMDSSMDASSSLSLSSTDTKPDISQLSINTSSNSFAGVMGMPSSSRYPSMSSHGYPTQQGSGQIQPGFFDIGMHSGMSPGGLPLQSPSLHSQSSMSPVHLHSPGSLTSPFSSIQSPTSTMGPPYHPSQSMQSGMGIGGGGGAHFQTSSTKHICAICGDRASGKHYGVYSCEGCKGFFKRTVRKDLQYACRDEKSCLIDKRQRNRCQYCRYMKCLATGMKREAVQEERQRAKERGEVEVESTTSANSEMPVENIMDAEVAVGNQLDSYMESSNDPAGGMCAVAEKQLYALVDWAKRIPHFTELSIDDQLILLKTAWNELLIAGFSHQSLNAKDCIVLASGLLVYRSNACEAGLDNIFDRVLSELISKMREMAMDKTELGCLRAIVLFNPDAKGLNSMQTVESLREKVYATLEEFCKQQYPEEPGRFAKLLLRLPALRSIGLKCLDHLFLTKLIGENSAVDTFLLDMLDNPNPSN